MRNPGLALCVVEDTTGTLARLRIQCRVLISDFDGCFVVMQKNVFVHRNCTFKYSGVVGHCVSHIFTWFKKKSSLFSSWNIFCEFKIILKGGKKGIPGWLSGLAPAFGSGWDPGVPGSSPTSGSLHGACFSLCLRVWLCVCVCVCVCRE